MGRRATGWVGLAFAGAALASAFGQVGTPPPATPQATQKVVIPFDFESRFDDGRYGRMVSDMVWKKLSRDGGFVLPESVQEVRDWCERNRFRPGPETPLAKMKDALKDQAGDIAVWGKVERVAGHETDVYDLWIKVVDFSADPPQVLYDKKARTQVVSDIPHTYVKEALDRLYARTIPPAPAADPAREERWARGANLVKGDFEQGAKSPAGWDPLPKNASLVREGKSRFVRFDFDEEVAGTTGVLYYSEYFPVEEGATYRFQCRWRSNGPAAKVFVKCYDELPTAFRDRDTASRGTEKREVYRSQQNLKGPAGTWNTHTEDFTPTHTQFTPRWGRVMLYAYWPAGRVDWDDVVVKQVAPRPAGMPPKDKRPSLETKVKTNELKK